jgi:hypothetical protein
MVLTVDLTSGGVSLHDHDDFSRCSVRAAPVYPGEAGALGAVAAALSLHDAGRVGPEGDVLIPVASLRRLAGESAARGQMELGPDWDAGFDAMVAYAATKGWIAEDGAIRSHIEWGEY